MPATVAVIIQPTRCISCTDVFQVSGPQSLRRRVMECGCSLCPFCSEKLKLTKLVACPVCSYQYKYTQGQEDWFHHSVTPADIAAQESRCQSVRNEIRAVQGSINDLTASEPSSDDDYSAIVRHVRVIEEREAEAKRQQEAAEAADIAAAAAAAEEEGKGNNGDGAVGALDMNGMRVHDDEDEDEDEDPLVDDDDDHHGDLDDPLNDDEGNGGEEEEKESEEQPPEKIKVKLLQEVILSDSSIDITSEDLDDDYSNTRYAIVTNRYARMRVCTNDTNTPIVCILMLGIF